MQQATTVHDDRRRRVMQAMAARDERRRRVLELFEDDPLILNVREVMRRLDDPDFSQAHVSIAVSELMSRGRLYTTIEGIRLVGR
ncbi:MAG: hypothetical protein OXF41_14135 [bacterium]|nr:hypothetical protein [bacterium]